MNDMNNSADVDSTGSESSILEMALPLVQSWRSLVVLPLLVGLISLGATYLVTPTFTAKTTFLPPSQQGSATASALASLGALAGIAGGAGPLRSTADQYVALLQSASVGNRMLDRFGLMSVFEARYRSDGLRRLLDASRFSVGKKDGLITIEVDDHDPKRAADMANAYVEELRTLNATLAITEAQQRRTFFDRQLIQTKEKLSAAQAALQSSGFNQGALQAEPRAAAEAYAKLRAEVTAAEVRLQALTSTLADKAPEVTTQRSALASLRATLAKVEQASEATNGPGYIGKYREFKYQETLFELFARQYELARADEAREGALIQVVDPAVVPERKSRPRRAIVSIVAYLSALSVWVAFLIVRHAWRQSATSPAHAEAHRRLRASWSGRLPH